MAVRSVHQLVLDEAIDVLSELAAWLRLAHACPKCEALQGCSHQPRCPLGRVARLRILFGSGDQRRRDVELAALRRERGDSTASTSPTITPSGHIDAGASMTPDRTATPSAREREQAADAESEAVDDEQALASVVEVLDFAATRCFSQASALRERAKHTGASVIGARAGARAAARYNRTARYAEAAAAWLLRNGANALLGQSALLRAFVREAAPPAAESEGAPR